MVYWWYSFGDFALGTWGYPDPIEVLKEYLELSGKSHAEVAEACGIKRAMVRHMLLYGESMDSVERLRDLSVVCEIPLELFGLAPQEPEEDLSQLVCRFRISRNWTQEQLATALGVHPKTVSSMENQGSSLDSLERRRALRFILGIPPALLGLDTLHVDPLSELPKPPRLSLIQVIQENLWTGYYTNHAQDQVAAARHAVSLIKASLPSLPAAERPAWLEQQSLLYQGIANVTREYTASKKVLLYSQEAVTLAKNADNADLLSLALTRQMSTAYLLGEYELAVKFAKEVDPKTADPVLLARVLALSATGEGARTQVFSLIDEQRWLSLNGSNDPYYLRSNLDIGLIQSAEARFNLSASAPDASYQLFLASELLKRVDPQTLAPVRLTHMKLLQARIALARGELDEATAWAVEAYPLTSERGNTCDLPKFVEIYRTLRQRKYASPYVEHLRWMLIRDNAIFFGE